MVAEIVTLTLEPAENPPPRSKFILLAGKRWPIPKLGPRQQRVIVPKANKLLRALMPKLFAANQEREAIAKVAAEEKKAQQPERAKTAEDVEKSLRVMLSTVDLTQEQYDDLVDITVAALSKLHPKVNREVFLDWDVATMELVMALLSISIQASILDEQAKPEERSSAVGEQAAESPKTGTNTSTT